MVDRVCMETTQELLLTSLSGHRMLLPNWGTAWLMVRSLFRDVQTRKGPGQNGTIQVLYMGMVIAEVEEV